MSWLIAMDVSGDAPREIIEKHDVRLIKMDYSVDGLMKTCTGLEDADELKPLYDAQRSGEVTRTSQIAPYTYEAEFERLLGEGKDVLYLCLSSGLSSTLEASKLASAALKQKYPHAEVKPFDTLAATGGMGILLERAAALRDAGKGIDEAYSELAKTASRIRHWFLVQDLMYLKRGGRVGGAEAVLGTALGIKPILIINRQGALEVAAKKRGAKSAAQEMLSKFREEYDPESNAPVSIVDSDAPDVADMLERGVKQAYPNAVTRRKALSPIIGAHTGPGMAAVIYIAKE